MTVHAIVVAVGVKVVGDVDLEREKRSPIALDMGGRQPKDGAQANEARAGNLNFPRTAPIKPC